MIEESRYKYETIKQRVSRFIIIGNSVLLIISILLFLIGFDVEFMKLRRLLFKISGLSFVLFMLTISSYLLYLLIKHDVSRYGIEQTIYNIKVQHSLEKALLDSKIYFERMNLKSSGNTILVSLPKIIINIEKGNMTGEVLIENSIKYQDKLEKIDLSSAVRGYVQESAYLLDNRDWYVFNLDLESTNSMFIFNSIENLNDQVMKTEKNSMFIDKKFSEIPYYHWLLSGQTGSGKTYGLYSLVMQLELQDVSLTIIDPKSSNLAVLGDVLGVKTAVETQDIIMTLRQVVADMGQRKLDVMQSVKESQSLDSTALDFGYQPEYIVIDEYAALQLRMDRKQKAELTFLIGQIVLEGRSLGFYLILAMQQANAKLIDTNLREQFQVQMVLGQSGIQTYNVIFGAHLASLIPSREMKRGEGWIMISGETTVPRLINFPYLNFEIIKEMEKFKNR